MNSSQPGPGFSIALLGGGTVGAAVARGLVSRYAEWGIDIAGIAVRDVAKAEATGLGKIAPLTTDPLALAGSDVDLVVELMGGLDPALPVVESALKAGRPVVTANKLLLANFGARLESLARASGAALRFESAVAAGVPVIGVLARDMAANEITSIKGIINGTTNYILTKMESEGWSYEQALAEAQKIGYAEADPRSDVEGEDAAAKLVILARMAAGAWPALLDGPVGLHGDFRTVDPQANPPLRGWRRTNGQGRRLRHSGPGGLVGEPHHRQLPRHRRPAGV